VAKIRALLAALLDDVEALTPTTEGSVYPYRRWSHDRPLSDPGLGAAEALRAVAVRVTGVGEGELAHGAGKVSRSARLDVCVWYPESYYPRGQTDHLGVDGLLAEDDAQLVAALVHGLPAHVAALTDVTHLQSGGESRREGRIWVIPLLVSYFEAVS
jgi:hypothetical protein